MKARVEKNSKPYLLHSPSISEAERELNEAAHKVEDATSTYETIVRRMSEDLARFQVIF